MSDPTGGPLLASAPTKQGQSRRPVPRRLRLPLSDKGSHASPGAHAYHAGNPDRPSRTGSGPDGRDRCARRKAIAQRGARTPGRQSAEASYVHLVVRASHVGVARAPMLRGGASHRSAAALPQTAHALEHVDLPTAIQRHGARLQDPWVAIDEVTPRAGARREAVSGNRSMVRRRPAGRPSADDRGGTMLERYGS
jgi:hypothetical protein